MTCARLTCRQRRCGCLKFPSEFCRSRRWGRSCLKCMRWVRFRWKGRRLSGHPSWDSNRRRSCRASRRRTSEESDSVNQNSFDLRNKFLIPLERRRPGTCGTGDRLRFTIKVSSLSVNSANTILGIYVWSFNTSVTHITIGIHFRTFARVFIQLIASLWNQKLRHGHKFLKHKPLHVCSLTLPSLKVQILLDSLFSRRRDLMRAEFRAGVIFNTEYLTLYTVRQTEVNTTATNNSQSSCVMERMNERRAQRRLHFLQRCVTQSIRLHAEGLGGGKHILFRRGAASLGVPILQSYASEYFSLWISSSISTQRLRRKCEGMNVQTFDFLTS